MTRRPLPGHGWWYEQLLPCEFPAVAADFLAGAFDFLNIGANLSAVRFDLLFARAIADVAAQFRAIFFQFRSFPLKLLAPRLYVTA